MTIANSIVVGQRERRGAGFLDNSRGHCGVISDWECPDDDVAVMRFRTSLFCAGKRIEDAITAASYKKLKLRAHFW